MKTVKKTKPKTTSEGGHAKNVAKLADLCADIIGYGPVYNPPRAELQVSHLQFMYEEGKAVLQLVAAKEVTDQGTGNERSKVFKGMSALTTRILNTMEACGLSKKTIADARAIQRRINGVRTPKKTNGKNTDTTETPTEETATETEGKVVAAEPRKNSVSRQSFDLLIEHFSKLILLLQREMNYTPNEPELQIGGLQAHEQYLRSLNEAATIAESELAAARMQRFRVLYDRTTGLVTLALQSKNYIKALFGIKSEQYKRVAKLPFRYIR